MAGSNMTDKQRAMLVRVWRAHAAGKWYRAADSGERVTLASLYHRRLLDRHAWRGMEGERDAAHEYCIAEAVRKAAAERKDEGGPPMLGDPPPLVSEGARP